MKSIFLYLRKPRCFAPSIFQILLPLLLAFGAQNASAALTITSVTLNGGSSVTVDAGETITVTVNETNTSGSNWRSTRFITSPTSTTQCSDHANRDGTGSHTVTFTVTAPTTGGTFDAVFRGSSNDTCGNTTGNSLTLTGAIVVRPPVAEINSTGGTSATNGLHIYVDRTTQIQVRRLNNTGQVYRSTSIPTSSLLDNGVFIRANGRVYGPSHTVSGFNPDAMFDTYKVSAPQPANPLATGVQQTVTSNMGINSGPQVQVLWKYVKPYDFLTADVTLIIPSGYSVSAANPVRYYHVFDTYLGGDDSGCGVKFTDSDGKLVIGTYQRLSNNCPSSTSLPAAAQVVESFRERTGQFSYYCVDYWWGLFGDNNDGCSVIQSAHMVNRVVSTYQDTGIGIEYDFTAPGTYIFSYDFVIGSTQVPPYDHIEIQHDGNATLCPDTIKVLACASSTVPCPDGSAVSTGTLTGTLTASGGSGVTYTPATFSVGSGGFLSSHQLQATSAGTVTLGANGLSHIPLNGVKCWNTASASQSCSFTIANTSCVGDFECLETSATYNSAATVGSTTNRNPLYTKVAGTDFKFDVVALLSSAGVPPTRDVAAGYTATANVTVELFDDSATPQPACSAYSAPVASQNLTFASTDNGRKTLPTSFNLPGVYKKLRCRVKDANMASEIYGCSTDQFSVRPSAVTVTSSDAIATPPSAAALPIIKAGTNFSLRATTLPTGYAGTLKLWGGWQLNDGLFHAEINRLTAQHTSNTSGVRVDGGVVGRLTPASLTANAAAISTATYSEVGYLYLNAGSFRDDEFTSVDSATGDCIKYDATDLTDTKDQYLRTSLPVLATDDPLAKRYKYGCSIGNVTQFSLGRFIPHHFDTVVTGLMTCAPGLTCPCSVGEATCPLAWNMAYSDQPLNIQVKAKAYKSGGTTDLDITRNYENLFASDVTLGAWSARGGTTTQNPPATNGGALSNSTVTSFDDGIGALNGAYGFTAAAVTAPTDVYVRAKEAVGDGVTSLDGTTAADSVEAGIKIVKGRLKLSNAVGSEKSVLKIPVQLQFWSGNSWVPSATDTTTLLSPTAVSLSGYTSSWTTSASGPIDLSKDGKGGLVGFITLAAPSPAGMTGSVDVAINLGSSGSDNACVSSHGGVAADMPWLRAPTPTACPPDATLANRDPRAKATFGIYTPESRRAVHVREIF